jgi:hypothetical protein
LYVHDYYTFSQHVPVQINFKVNCIKKDKHVKYNNVPKLIWDNEKVNDYNNFLLDAFSKLNNIVNQIISSNITISEDVDNFVNVLYNAVILVM